MEIKTFQFYGGLRPPDPCRPTALRDVRGPTARPHLRLHLNFFILKNTFAVGFSTLNAVGQGFTGSLLPVGGLGGAAHHKIEMVICQINRISPKPKNVVSTSIFNEPVYPITGPSESRRTNDG